MNCDISSCSAEDTALVTAFVNSGCVEPTQDNYEQEYPNYGPATTDAADAMPAMNLEAFHMEFNDSPITGSAPTPLLVNNKECTASDQCESGKCLMWPWNHSIGSCRPRIPNGDPCSINAECYSNICDVDLGESIGECAAAVGDYCDRESDVWKNCKCEQGRCV